MCDELDLQENPTIAADNLGGAFVAWTDLRAAFRDIFAHHVTNTGVRNPSWPTQGISLCSADGDQELPAISLDGASGVIVGWQDFRSGTGYDVYAQRASSSGVSQWATDGVPAAATAGFRQDVQIVSDDGGGVIVAWADLFGGDIYAQRLAADGSVAIGWPVNGLAVCTAPGPQTNPTLVSDEANGAIIAWDDGRLSGNSDIFAQRITGAGEPGPTTSVPPSQAPGILGMSISPNPAQDFVEIRLKVETRPVVDLRIHDLQGREVAEVHRGPLPPGTNGLRWPLRLAAGPRVPPGIYLARVLVEGAVITGRFVVLE